MLTFTKIIYTTLPNPKIVEFRLIISGKLATKTKKEKSCKWKNNSINSAVNKENQKTKKSDYRGKTFKPKKMTTGE